MTISKHCFVSFFIGAKYQDRVWCDVVTKDACHLLLGRPWQYDRGAIHNGKQNTNSFAFDKMKIVIKLNLDPL